MNILAIGDIVGDVGTEMFTDHIDALKKKYAITQTRVHNYCVDVLPPYSVYVRFDDGGNRIVIRLQPSNHLLEVLRSACP